MPYILYRPITHEVKTVTKYSYGSALVVKAIGRWRKMLAMRSKLAGKS